MQKILWAYYGSLATALVGLFLVVTGILNQPIVYPLFVLPLLAYEVHHFVTCQRHKKISALIIGGLGFVLLVMLLLIIHN